ncbi:ROK family protein [Fundicoccus culcitae]|uniref:ROK family protein n=1 Tax=Fundicoccus culcitae TaxID=2969821 RepID=A0ABY5P8N1_9LACT|nr:ROK family protein [Fundicoccus culcitae]UUX35029.1 ROK family protein [Fundicoccus culcitae]
MSLLTLDIGGTLVKYGLWADDGLVSHHAVPTPKTWEAFLALLAKLIDTVDRTITGIACSFPGIVNTQTGWIGGASSVPYIHGFSMTDALTQQFQLPVSVENDAKCALLAEHQFGHAKGQSNVALMVIGTGIGGAIMIDGKLLKGRNLYAGELGCLLMENDIMLSDIGSTARMVQEYTTTHQINTPIDGLGIFDLYDKGDDTARQSVHLFYDYIARGVFNTLVTIDPDLVLLGGGVSARPDFAEAIAVRVQDMLIKQRLTDLTFDIQSCYFDNRANLIGAAVNYQQQFNV